jgi:hypothetical protein
MSTTASAESLLQRNVLILTTPELWETRPFLALVRHLRGKEQEEGVLCELPGFGFTVLLCNFFLLPKRLEDIRSLPQEVYHSPEEVYAAGWRVDG